MINDILAVIPARGGSKGVPRKNVLPIGGKPLIAHTIEAAQGAAHVTRVVVSTDDEEIAAVARRFGADVVDRPAALASDTARSEDALLHALEQLDGREGYRPDLLLFLQCTSPFTSSDDIDGLVEMLIEQDADSALTVAPSHHFLWRRDEQGGAHGVNHDKRSRPRRQERDPQFLETGAAYAMRTNGFLAARHRFFGHTVLFETPPERCLEIDDPDDFRRAEERMAGLRRRSLRAALPERVGVVVMDFDGVFTDDRVVVDQDGREAVICSRRDGMGIEHLRRAGMPLLVISKEVNSVVAARCRKLDVPCLSGIEGKLPILSQWLEREGHRAEAAVYIGNDLNDVECLRHVGCGIVPRDAHPQAIAAADVILDADGGRGALRLLSDLLLADAG